MSILFEIIEDTLIDTARLIPFLYLTYLLMEFLEHKAAGSMQRVMQRSGRLGPVLGGLLGAVPQCGFSAAAASLYAGRVITLGTLIAIFLSTSDEMLPILLSNSSVSIGMVGKILFIKVVIGMAAGIFCDALLRKWICADAPKAETRDHHHHEHHEHHDHAHDHPATAIHELCEQDHCHCAPGGNIFLSALIHTLKIALFILGVSFVLNAALGLIGEDALQNLLLNRPVISQLIAALVGLIPNCASSVVLTQLFVEGALSFAACMAGLLTGSGVGILVLFRTNRRPKENLKILALLYALGVGFGLLLEALPIAL